MESGSSSNASTSSPVEAGRAGRGRWQVAEVFELDEHRPHVVGYADCVSCGHEWVTVAPLVDGCVPWLQCPECGEMRGGIRQVEDEDA